MVELLNWSEYKQNLSVNVIVGGNREIQYNTNINTTTISASVASLTNGSRVQLILPTLLLKSLKKYYHHSYNN